ncbi:MAG: 30S ribosomal protein S20 [Candidatus Fraserbacteria bacterium RBG_16_55_9]|uniref:Small ribosomal subunit protein bS20 n=1 Tax=Fraserbacteria sp. (strain RBG_16_55_9) TaxID=1817864 RepID=A0A1F5V1D6_FRAXR|nr:MAG: 30S ribosomal protein S20 [Candidatus Fraserbacteria bacterium RBG_16_55_9]
MPNTKTAKKNLRQSLKRREKNLERKKAFQHIVKQLKKAIAAGDQTQVKELVPQVMKAADKAAKKHLIHPNKAARLKSRLMKRVQAASRP